jgi:uncharacterized protein (TIGR03382 family)
VRSLITAVLLASPVTALACSFEGFRPWFPDPGEVELDRTPPGPATLSVDRIQRGVGFDRRESSCDDLGWVVLSAVAEDDRTPASELGYEFEVVGGSPPEGIDIPTMVVRWFDRLIWLDGATDTQEPFSFRLRVRAVDLAGNRGPWSEPITIHDEGREEDNSGGCSASTGPPSLLALGLLMAIRHRVSRLTPRAASAIPGA